MAKDNTVAQVEKEEAVQEEMVSKAEYDKVVAERNKYAEAVSKLINTMAQRYANDLAKDVLSDNNE